MLNNLQEIHLKLLQNEQFKKHQEATGNLIDTIADRITKVSKNSQQSNSETVINEHDKEISKER